MPTARMKKDGPAVRDLIQNMDDFNADPFDKCAPELHSLQFGVIASSEVLEYLQNTLEEDEK